MSWIQERKGTKKESDDNFFHHTLNTIIWGFIGGGETSSARKRYTHQILTIEGSSIDSNLGEIVGLKCRYPFPKKMY